MELFKQLLPNKPLLKKNADVSSAFDLILSSVLTSQELKSHKNVLMGHFPILSLRLFPDEIKKYLQC